MRFALATALLAAAVSSLVGSFSLERQRKATPAEEVMWRKLDLAHDSLDALALDDFEALEAYAEDLVSLGHAGEALESDTPGYRVESEQFLRAARALGEAARERSTESAALAYVDLTLRCIRCHRALGALPR